MTGLQFKRVMPGEYRADLPDHHSYHIDNVWTPYESGVLWVERAGSMRWRVRFYKGYRSFDELGDYRLLAMAKEKANEHHGHS
jgi:hypothetical protein